VKRVDAWATVASVGYQTATVVCAILGKTLICITFSVLYVFANELFPTEIRNVGVGTASMSARLSSMAASFAGGPLVGLSAAVPILASVYGVIRQEAASPPPHP